VLISNLERPVIRIPLRRPDPDAGLDLQALVDQCYERGRYASSINYSNLIPSPPLPAEEAEWVRSVTAVNG